MKASRLRLAAITACLTVAVRGLAWLTPAPAALLQTLRHPQEAAEHSGIDVVALAVAGIACWACLLWLVVAVLSSAGACLPGQFGRLADTVAAAAVPAAARRVLAVALGLAVVTGPGAATAMAGVLPPPRAGVATPDLDWPVAGQRPGGTVTQAAPQPSAPADVAERSAPTAQVIVQRGDSLWAIARQHLPADAGDTRVAADWPHWYFANREVIGPDPDVLLPGQRLVPPQHSTGGQP